MYLLVIYNNPHKTSINAIYKFSHIKDIINWSGGMINYSDATNKQRKYKTYKSFFRVLRCKNNKILVN